MTAKIVLLLALATVVVLLVGCHARQASAQNWASSSVPAAVKMIWSGSYTRDIQPIFDRNCVSCHGPNRAENGLKLTSYDEIMKGTQYGAVVVPGSPSASALLSVVQGGVDPSIRMPLGAQRLSDAELMNLVLWIEAGAPGN